MSSKSFFFFLFIVFTAILFSVLLAYKTTLALYPLTAAQDETIGFVQHYAPLSLNYTATELSHLYDVHLVVLCTDLLFGLSLLMMAILIGEAWKDKPKLAQICKLAGKSILAFNAVMLIIGLFLFNYAFTIFHKIFFPQGNWIFPTESLLIQTFPQSFFVSISAIIFIAGVVIGSLFITAEILIHKYGSHPQN